MARELPREVAVETAMPNRVHETLIINELLHDTNRLHDTLVGTAIDFTNAFGSVPHEMIMSMMKQRNLPTWMQHIIADMYRGATSIIEMKGKRSEKIAWKRGVKQGCPLSPLLFNLCLEPLLQAVKEKCWDWGAFPGRDGDRIGITVQAYADDLIFISRKAKGIPEMMKILERFVEWSNMEVNAKKCAMASYIFDEQRRRCSLADNLVFKGQSIPNLTFAQSLKYLGTSVTVRRTVKFEAVQIKLTKIKIRLERIVESPLQIVQKIDAMKIFDLPTLDFMILNGDVGETQLTEMDRHIRGLINGLLKVRGLPRDCHHPSLVDHRQVLMIRSFAQMMMSRDETVCKRMRWFAEGE
jgi:hypothetical protein